MVRYRGHCMHDVKVSGMCMYTIDIFWYHEKCILNDVCQIISVLRG